MLQRRSKTTDITCLGAVRSLKLSSNLEKEQKSTKLYENKHYPRFNLLKNPKFPFTFISQTYVSFLGFTTIDIIGYFLVSMVISCGI